MTLCWDCALGLRDHRIHYADKELSKPPFMLVKWKLRRQSYSQSNFLFQGLVIASEPRLSSRHVFVLWACVSVLMCWEGEAVSPCQTDGYQQGSREWMLLYSGAKRLSCNLHCLSLIFPPARCFHLLSVRLCVAFVCVHVLIYSLCTPMCEYQCAW